MATLDVVASDVSADLADRTWRRRGKKNPGKGNRRQENTTKTQGLTKRHNNISHRPLLGEPPPQEMKQETKQATKKIAGQLSVLLFSSGLVPGGIQYSRDFTVFFGRDSANTGHHRTGSTSRGT